MQKIVFYAVLMVCLVVTKMTAQESFEARAKTIAETIENITKEEKESLKNEVEEINKQLEKGKLTQEQAQIMKNEAAALHSKNIEERVALEQQKLNDLVQEKVNGGISDTTKTKEQNFVVKFLNSEKEPGIVKRTSTQFVIASGFNNLVTNGAVANSDFYYLRSVFWEWGITGRTRLGKITSPLHFKYGFSFMYNMLSATDDRYFVDEGSQTVLEQFPVNLREKDTYFKNVYFVVPLHLEFDFSKLTEINGKMYRKSHEGFRLGLGGFVGYNTNSKQFLSYKADGYRIYEKQKGNWNVNDWNYGLSAYAGWKETSLYLKYDLNPLFENNAVDQHNVSLGIRFDLN